MPSFTDILSQAADLTAESFGDHIARTLIAPENGRLRHSIAQEYDRRQGYSVNESMKHLDREIAFFYMVAEEATDEKRLVAYVKHYVQNELHRLYFVDNDLPSSRIKVDALKHFMEATVRLLDQHKMLSKGAEEQLESLVELYELGQVSYLALREDVSKRSSGRFASLRDWAHSELKKQKDPSLKKLNTDHITGHAEELFRQMLGDFGLQYEVGAQPHPALYGLVTDIWEVARRQAKNTLGPEASADEKRLTGVAEKRYGFLLKAANAMVSSQPNEQGIPKAYDYIAEERAAAFQLPRDYDKCLERAAKQAEKVTLAALPRRCKEAESEQKRHWSSSRDLALSQNLNIGTLPRAEKAVHAMLGVVNHDVACARDHAALVHGFDKHCDQQAGMTMFGCDEPVQLLSMQDYVKGLSKALASELKKEGLPSREVCAELALIEQKYALAYRSHWNASEWCLMASGNKYDNFGLQALMQVCHENASQFPDLEARDRNRIPHVGQELYNQAADRAGVPRKYCDNPYTPLLFEACLDHAVEDQHAREMKKGPLFSDRVGVPGKAEFDHMIKRAGAARVFEPQALQLFRNTMNMFPKDEQGAPIMHAAALKEALDFFEPERPRGLAN